MLVLSAFSGQASEPDGVVSEATIVRNTIEASGRGGLLERRRPGNSQMLRRRGQVGRLRLGEHGPLIGGVVVQKSSPAA